MSYTDAINSSKVVLVEFYATWCSHCRRMEPIMDQLKELLRDTISIVQLDIDKNEDLADAEKITSTPTFIIYQNGKQVWRESGEMDAQYLLDKIQSYL